MPLPDQPQPLEPVEDRPRGHWYNDNSVRLVAPHARPWKTRGVPGPHDLHSHQKDFEIFYTRERERRVWHKVWNYVETEGDYASYVQAPEGTRMAADPLCEVGCPYTVILRKDEDGDFVARVEELPGCAAHAKSALEALNNLEEAKGLWISDCLETSSPVPEPTVEEVLPSGKWVQRVPRSLHKKLVMAAKREGVSLNQLVTSVLAEAVGRRQAGDRRQKPRENWDCSVTG